jgi:hypothetical protein
VIKSTEMGEILNTLEYPVVVIFSPLGDTLTERLFEPLMLEQ